MAVKPKRLGTLLVTSMLEYGKQTIEDRVIADYRDGLKPVHRRCLWALYQAKAFSSSNFKKKASIVGLTMKYHPHGDAPISDALTGMVHDRYPLVEGYGGWGSPVYGDPAGAMRYIECRLSPLGESFRKYLPVTKLVPNYSGEDVEPLVLHFSVPLYLLNGGSGIAVAINFGVPPHNARELCNLIKALAKNPDLSWDEIIGILGGPDYPQGGVLVSSKEELKRLYQTGKGTLKFRCAYHFEEVEGKPILVITSGAPGIKLNRLLDKLAELQEKKVVEFVQDMSGKDGIRIVVGITSTRSLETKVLPLLYSTVNYSFCVTERTEDGAIFSTTNLRSYIIKWLEYRQEITKAYLHYLLQEQEKKRRRLEITLLVINNLDEVIKAVRAKDPIPKLKKLLKLNEEEAQYVLDRSLRSFTKASESSIKAELNKTKAEIKKLQEKLRNVLKVVLEELEETTKLIEDERRTKLYEKEPKLKIATEEGILVFKANLKWHVEKPDKPTRSKGEWIVSTEDPFLLLTPEGRGKMFQFPELKGLDNYKRNVACVVQVPSKGGVAILTDQNKLLIVPSEKLVASSRERNIIKGKVVSAVPVPDLKGELIAVTKRGPKAVEIKDYVGNLGRIGKKLPWKTVTKILPEEFKVLLLEDGKRSTDNQQLLNSVGGIV